MSNARTVGDTLSLALEVRWGGSKDEERTHHRATLAASSLPKGGTGRRVASVTPSDLRAAHVTLSRAHGVPSANRAIAALRGALRVALEEGWVGRVPPFRPGREGPGRGRAPTRGEVAMILRGLRGAGPTGYGCAVLARYLYLTGSRLGEALTGEVLSDGRVRYGSTKGGGARTITLPEPCPRPPFGVARSTFARDWGRARSAAGLGDWFVPHTLRHARVTELLRAGVPIPAVAGYVGHKSWSTTARYHHGSAEDSARCARSTRNRGIRPPSRGTQ